MADRTEHASVEPIVRGLTAAAKALRLYPPTSPIPRQAVDAAHASLAAFLASEPVLSFRVVRDGLAWRGETVAAGAPGAVELADALRDHGVAELDFLPGVVADELVALLTAAVAKPDDLRAGGGIAGTLASAGADHVRTAAVSLTVVDPLAGAFDDSMAGDFLRELAGDADRVTAWLGVAARSDASTLAAGLADLATAAGEENLASLVASLSSAFAAQDADARDAVIGVSLDEGPARDLLGKVFARSGTAEMASTLCGGLYGRNMLSLSTALTKLPLAERVGDVLAQVKLLLPEAGRGAKEVAFLDHMMAVRSAGTAEDPLADRQPAYRQVAELARVDEAHVATARAGVADAAKRADDSAVSTMLTLLDQQDDFTLYTRTLEALAGMVAPLLERGRLDLSARIVRELSAREARSVQPWPELTGALRTAIGRATDQRTMEALIAAVAAGGDTADAREIVQHASDAGTTAFVGSALAHRPDGLAIAERIAGRRIVDLLAAAAPHLQWFQIAPLATRLVGEPDARAQQAVEALTRRPDDASRREAATGLAQAGGPLAARLLATLMRDPSAEVAIAATRSLGRAQSPGVAALLRARLDELDVDGKDFAVARELIGALAHTGDPGATEVLKGLASRRALIKRGHFAEVQDLANQALSQRAKAGGR